MDTGPVLRAWGSILTGGQPNLSIEITRECPLRCPGCYAYGDTHLGGDVVLRELADFKGQALIDGLLQVVRRRRPIHLSIVGGEPLVRFRELDVVLPQLTAMGVHTQVVTSAVRPIPVVVGGHAGAAGGGVDRRTAARTRRAPDAGHLRAHPQAHRRAAHHGALHADPAAGAARLRRRVHASSGRPTATSSASGSASTRRRAAKTPPERLRPADRALLVEEIAALYATEPKLSRHAAVGRARLPQPAAQSRRLHLREDDGLPVGGLKRAITPVPVRRGPRLLAVRLHGLSRAAGAGRLPARRVGPAQRDLQGVDCRRQWRRALARALARLTAAPPQLPYTG